MNVPAPDKPELSLVEGGGDPDSDGRTMLERARDAVESALGLRHDAEPEGPYGHLSPVPDQPELPDPQAEPGADDADTDDAPRPTVVPITSAPSHESNQAGRPEYVHGSSALSEPPIPVNAEGEIDSSYKAIRDARLKVDLALAEMPSPEPSAIEDLMRQ